MQRGISVIKLFGIEIRLDPSWFFIFFLITWNLATAFGSLHPEWSVTLRWGGAAAAALLFFASVLVHEYAHSLVARAQGVDVRTITLHLFGGVSNIERHPPSPRAEFLITIVGPITSFVLGIAFLLLGGVQLGQMASATQQPEALIQALGPLPTLLLWLGSINIILAIFNLVPGFPLDGGRILRSILWAATKNLTRATRWASGVGQAVAWSFIVGGIAMAFGAQLPFFGTGVISGLWLAFIGWFLNNAAVASYQQILVQDVLEDVTVRRIMHTEPSTVPAHISLEMLVDDYMMASDERSFPVMDGGQVVGIVAIEDVRKVPRGEWPRRHVVDVMTTLEDMKSVEPQTPAAEALSILGRMDVKQLPVMENGRLAGLLRRKDILRWLELQRDIDA